MGCNIDGDITQENISSNISEDTISADIEQNNITADIEETNIVADIEETSITAEIRAYAPSDTPDKGYSIGISGNTINSSLVVGKKLSIKVDYACTISAWSIVSNVSGTAVVDVWKSTTGNKPKRADSIVGSYLTLTDQQYNVKSDLSDWDTLEIEKGDTITFYVSEIKDIQSIWIDLWVEK